MEATKIAGNKITPPLTTLCHWAAFVAFASIYGYAGAYKVFKIEGMMNGMASMGFHEPWTLAIGYAEVIGVAGLLVGIVKPVIKRLAILWLFPFGIGAFTVHMSLHHAFNDYFNSLLVCVLSIVLFMTDNRFKLVLH